MHWVGAVAPGYPAASLLGVWLELGCETRRFARPPDSAGCLGPLACVRAASGPCAAEGPREPRRLPSRPSRASGRGTPLVRAGKPSRLPPAPACGGAASVGPGCCVSSSSSSVLTPLCLGGHDCRLGREGQGTSPGGSAAPGALAAGCACLLRTAPGASPSPSTTGFTWRAPVGTLGLRRGTAGPWLFQQFRARSFPGALGRSTRRATYTWDP